MLFTFYVSYMSPDGDPQYAIKTRKAGSEHEARRIILHTMLTQGKQVVFIRFKGKDAVLDFKGNSPYGL